MGSSLGLLSAGAGGSTHSAARRSGCGSDLAAAAKEEGARHDALTLTHAETGGGYDVQTMSTPEPAGPMAPTITAETMEFGDLVVRFDRRVLRPRRWTTEQSRWAAELLRGAPEGPVLELCAGVAQIGLLAILGQRRDLVCVDVNPVACAFARDNAAAADLERQVDVRQGSIDAVLAPGEAFALVIADPPWVPHDSVVAYPEDPTLAIDGGRDGLDLARACARVASDHLLPGGSVLLQLGDEEQAALLSDELPLLGDLELTELRTFPRGVLARLELRRAATHQGARNGHELA